MAISKDEQANKSFEKFASQLECEIPKLPSEELGVHIMPILSEAVRYGRTTRIKIRACEITIKVLQELDGRADSKMEVICLTPEKAENSMMQGMAGLINELQKMASELRVQEDKAHVAKPVSKLFENVSVDDILKTPMAKDLERPND